MGLATYVSSKYCTDSLNVCNRLTVCSFDFQRIRNDTVRNEIADRRQDPNNDSYLSSRKW